MLIWPKCPVNAVFPEIAFLNNMTVGFVHYNWPRSCVFFLLNFRFDIQLHIVYSDRKIITKQKPAKAQFYVYYKYIINYYNYIIKKISDNLTIILLLASDLWFGFTSINKSRFKALYLIAFMYLLNYISGLNMYL